MSELEYRTLPPVDLEVRASERTVVGVAVPFDEVAEIGFGDFTYRERFVRGAFERTIRERGDRVKVLAQHSRDQLPIGKARSLKEDSKGLVAELRISKTAIGDEVLELVSDGALDSLSIGFRPIRDRKASDGVLERVEVRLDEISLVPFPAYEAARVLAVRSVPSGLSIERAEALIARPEVGRPSSPLSVDMAEQWLDLIRG